MMAFRLEVLLLAVAFFATCSAIRDENLNKNSLALGHAQSSCRETNVFREDKVATLFQNLTSQLKEKIRGADGKLSGLTPADFEEELKKPAAHDLERMAKYIVFEKLHDDNPEIYYETLRKFPEHALPVVYTPTVGLACQTMHNYIESPRGLYIPAGDWLGLDVEQLGTRMAAALEACGKAFPELDAAKGFGGIMVVTDGSRILGLRDQGAGGVGIPMGKTSLYVAASGIRRQRALPVVVDFGIETEKTLWSNGKWCDEKQENITVTQTFGTCRKVANPDYFGLRMRRLNQLDEHVFPAMDAFVRAAKLQWPNVVLQWEDWFQEKAFALLKRHRGITYTTQATLEQNAGTDGVPVITSFNDDIQGTGAMTYGALLSAVKKNGQNISQQRILFLGTGSAAMGVAETIVSGVLNFKGLALDNQDERRKARGKFAFVNSGGLLMRDTYVNLMSEEMRDFADVQAITNSSSPTTWWCDKKVRDGVCPKDVLQRYILEFKPQILVGLVGVGGMFDEKVLRNMKKVNYDDRSTDEKLRPIVFALSNPLKNSECTAEQAYNHTANLAIYASGTRMPKYVQGGGKPDLQPSQGNNMYVFPGVGFAAAFGHFRSGVPEEALIAAAEALANTVTEEEFAQGAVLPAVKRVVEVNRQVADAVFMDHHRRLLKMTNNVDTKLS